MHSASELQAVRQAVAPHRYGEQVVTLPAVHTPNPSQAYPVCVPELHVLVPQVVPLG